MSDDTRWMIDYPEPVKKVKFVSMRQLTEIWDGKEWKHFSTLYFPSHPGKIREQIMKEAENVYGKDEDK